MRLTYEEISTLIAFIKMHEREEIPDDVWDLCMRMYDELEEKNEVNQCGQIDRDD